MPVYHYRGIACDHEFEIRQSFSDDAIANCEVCGLPVRRVIHASPVVFKGSGWYITDSRPTSDPIGGVKDVTKTADDSAKPAEKSTEKSEKSEKSEAKPAAKAEPVAATTKAK